MRFGLSSPAWLAIAVIAVALNLRPVLAAIGPLLDTIEAHAGLSHAQASLLTTLPVFVMGLGALGASGLGHWLRERRAIALGVALIAVACAARWVATERLGLLVTAVIAGSGIALVQSFLPAFIKRHFGARSGTIFGLYTTGIMGGAAIAAASAATLASWTGWSGTLALWALPAVLALPLWALVTASDPGPAPVTATAAPGPNLWRSRRAWELMLFFGIGTGAYTLVLAWLPPFYTSLGWLPSSAGLLLGGVSLAEVVAGLTVSAFIGRFPDRRGPLLAALLLLAIGLACLILAPLSLALIGCLVLGIGIGALFPLSLIVTLDHVDDPAQAGRLAAFVQGGGYIIASAMPLLAGLIRDRFADLTQAWTLMAVGALVLAVLCLRFSPRSYRRIGGLVAA